MKSEQNALSLGQQALFGPSFQKVKTGVAMSGSATGGASGPGFSTILSALDIGDNEDCKLEPVDGSVLAGAAPPIGGFLASEQPPIDVGLADSVGLTDQRATLDSSLSDVSLKGPAMAVLAGLISDATQFANTNMISPAGQTPLASVNVDASQAQLKSLGGRQGGLPLTDALTPNQSANSRALAGFSVAEEARSASFLVNSPEPVNLLGQSVSLSGRAQIPSTSEPRSSLSSLGDNPQSDAAIEFLQHFRDQRAIQVVESNRSFASPAGDLLTASSKSLPNGTMWQAEKPVLAGAGSAQSNSIQSASNPLRSRVTTEVTESRAAKSLDGLDRFFSNAAERLVALKPLTEASPQGSTELVSAQASNPESKHTDEGLWGPQVLFSGGRMNYSAAQEVVPIALPEGLADQVKYWISNDVQSAELRLDGFDGATVDVSISMQGNETRIDFRSDQIEIREILENSSHQLKDSLAREGLMLSDVSVGDSQHRGNSPKEGQRRMARMPSALEKEPDIDEAIPNRRDPAKRALDVFV